MAITHAAKKGIRQIARRRTRNIKKRNDLKKLLKEAETLIAQKKGQEAKKLLPQVYKLLDKAAQTDLIKKNTAERRKSRITRAISKIK